MGSIRRLAIGTEECEPMIPASNADVVLYRNGSLGVKQSRYLKIGEYVPHSNLFVAVFDRVNVPMKGLKDSKCELDELSRA